MRATTIALGPPPPAATPDYKRQASRQASRELNNSAGRQQVVYRAGAGPPLVWLHGLYGVEADAPLIEALAESFSVYAPLAPGFADLDELDDIRDIHDLALHYDDVMQAVARREAISAGHSFGAMRAAGLAARFPSRGWRRVLHSPRGGW